MVGALSPSDIAELERLYSALPLALARSIAAARNTGHVAEGDSSEPVPNDQQTMGSIRRRIDELLRGLGT